MSVYKTLKAAVLLLLVFQSTVLLAQAQPVDPAASLPEKNLGYLSELLDSALKQSPRMVEQSIAIARAEADVLNAKSARLPSLNGNVRYAYETVSASKSPSTAGQGFFYNLNATQSLYRWGETRSTIEINELERLMKEKSYAEAYRSLAAEVRAQFLALIITHKGLGIRAQAMEQSSSALAELQERNRIGLTSLGELKMAEMSLEEAKFSQERERYDFEGQRRGLARLVGMQDIPEDRIPDTLPAPVVQPDQAARLLAWFEQSDRLEATPSIMMARTQVRQGDLRYQVARVRLLPKLELQASNSLENTTYLIGGKVDQSATNRSSIGIAANWNIFDGFATRAAKRRALADRREAEGHLKSALQSFADQKQVSVTQFEFATRALGFAERRLDLSRQGLAYTEQEVKSGRQSSAAVEGMRNSVLSAESSVLSARATVYARWGDLLALLWADPCLEKLPVNFLSHGK